MKSKIEYLFTPVPKKNVRKLFGSNLAVYENRVLRYIEYRLYDMGYKKDKIGIDQIARATRISKRNVSKIILSLKLRHIITREGCITGFVEDIEAWDVTSTEKYVLSTSIEKEKRISVEGLNTSTKKTISKSLEKIEKKRGFIKPGKRKISRKVPEGLKEILKNIGNFPGKKR